MMPELITIAIAIGFLYGLHRLIEAIRNRKVSREDSLLDNLGFDSDQHELTVRLSHGGTITGTPHPNSNHESKDGIILTNARTSENEKCPACLHTFRVTASPLSEPQRRNTNKTTINRPMAGNLRCDAQAVCTGTTRWPESSHGAPLKLQQPPGTAYSVYWC